MKLHQLILNNQAAPRDVRIVQAGREATLYLYDIIGEDWFGGVAAKDFVPQLAALDVDTIHLRINSPGGSVFAARAMEQALRDHKGKVIVHIDGLAASAATFIAMAGEEVIMAKGAMFMIHKAWTEMWGNADDLRKEAELLDKIDGTLAETYASKTGKDLEQVSSWMAEETWFTAAEALEHGFATSIAETDAKASAWNLSAYDKAPKPQSFAQPPNPRKSLHLLSLKPLLMTTALASSSA